MHFWLEYLCKSVIFTLGMRMSWSCAELLKLTLAASKNSWMSWAWSARIWRWIMKVWRRSSFYWRDVTRRYDRWHTFHIFTSSVSLHACFVSFVFWFLFYLNKVPQLRHLFLTLSAVIFINWFWIFNREKYYFQSGLIFTALNLSTLNWNHTNYTWLLLGDVPVPKFIVLLYGNIDSLVNEFHWPWSCGDK